MSTPTRVCLIGFGEVGQTLARDLIACGVRDVATWDVQFAYPHSAPSLAVAGLDVRRATGLAEAIRGAEVVVCAVTAANCMAVAQSVAAIGLAGGYFLDLNSVAPDTKCGASQLIEQGGGRYVEAAVMSPIAPRGIGSPILLGGTHAEDFLAGARALGFTGASAYSPGLGRASAAKMCRSVVIKGVEALLTESLVSARRYGVEQTVLASLAGLLPAGDWPVLSRYMISRALEHGARRAEEMREAALTVAGAGVDPWMTSACAARQEWCAKLGAARHEPSLESMLDALLAQIPDPRGDARC